MCDHNHKLSMDRKSCIMTCPEDQVVKKGVLSNICAPTYGATTYISSDLTECVQECKVGEFKLQFACVVDCNRMMHNATHCLDSCPNGKFQELVSRICVDSCPPGQIQENNRCLCPIGWYETLNNYCKTNCEADQLVDSFNQQCVRQCQGSYLDIKSQKCIQKCPPGQIPDQYQARCICSTQTRLNMLTFTCECPQNQLILLNNQCGDACPYGSNIYNTNGQKYCVCVNYISSDFKSCVNVCSSQQFMDITKTICLEKCPPQFFVDFKGIQCVHSCGINQVSNQSKYCKCNRYYSINIQESGCIYQCPQDQIIYGGHCACSGEGANDSSPTFDSKTNTCICPANTYFSAELLTCVLSCRPTFEILQGRCVCPIGKFLSVDLQACYTNCNFAKQQKISPDGRACQEECAPTQVLSLFGDQCLEFCPQNSQTNENRQCMCVSGLISLDGKQCVKTCGIGESQFYNASSGQYRCKCAKNLILTDGKCTCANITKILNLDYTVCLLSCPIGQQQISNGKQLYCACSYYIASNNKSCVVSCSPTDIIDNLNKRCVSICVYPLLLSSDKLYCIQDCKIGEFISVKRTECQSSCSPGEPNQLNRCECQDSLKISLNGNKCISQCGVGEKILPFEFYSSCQCVSGLQNINNTCQCVTGYMNLDQQTCITTCPAYTTQSVFNGIKMCTCPKYVGIDNQSCVSDCGNNQASIDNLHCLSICYPNIMSLDKKQCVTQCGDNQTKLIQNKLQLDYMCVCDPGLIPNSDSTSCLQCKYYSVANTIVSCVDTCRFPKSLAKNFNISDQVYVCKDSCGDKYINRATQYCDDKCDYLNRTGKICEQKQDLVHCPILRVIDVQYVCVADCDQNEKLENNICVKITKPESNQTVLFIYVVVFGVIITAIILFFIIFCVYRKYSKRGNVTKQSFNVIKLRNQKYLKRTLLDQEKKIVFHVNQKKQSDFVNNSKLIDDSAAPDTEVYV
ncbi:Conserved_hypothetical protein [Hexamita inflata]|uniref:Uncharacterized protein n=1 Tax=Hexamita inflata TaxID=28002 RepID=A0AA86PZX1_9EUKA|nr:Conserved hypothetical protein [Hexamita inflata]